MFCEVPIKHGTHAYGEKAEILLTAYAWDDNPVDVLEEFIPAQIQQMVDDADTIIIHNSFFDRTVYGYNGVVIPVEKIEDTMVTAFAHALPGALDSLCDVLGVAADKAKHKEGKKLINLFCKPRPKNVKLRRATKETHPEEWKQFVEYARFDIVSMRECRRLMPRWNLTPAERKLWILDQKINDRGIKVDMDLAHAALRAADRAQETLAARIDKLTDGKVKSATQRAALKAHLEEDHDYDMVDMTKGSVAAALKGDMSDETRELLEIRQQAASTSSAKYPVLIRSSSTYDRRLRGTLQFCGASRTQRWGGRMFQPQNLMRPTMRQDQIDLGIDAMLADCEDLLFENVMELCGNAVRGALIAEKAKKLVVADLSNIEGRVVAWLAGEEWKVKAFQEYDKGIGHDLYVLAYSRAFGVTPEEVLADKKHGIGLMRAVGKVAELSCQYGGALGAFAKMAAIYGVSLSDDQIIDVVKKWRKANSRIVSFWYDIEWACRQALRNKGESFTAGVLTMDRIDLNDKKWLRIKAPSGSYLSYPNADERDDGTLVYDGVDQYTHQWSQLDTYGPKLLQNITEKVARDILAEGMKKAEAAGYEVCLHAHDELITETPDADNWTQENLSAMMVERLTWTMGLPLAAAGFSTFRYKKDQS
jgi:DNA polymerase bacteriophage-type